MRGIEHEARGITWNRKSRRHFCGEFGVANSNARETDAAQIIDALDIGRQQARRRRCDVDEFGTHPDLDLRAGWKRVVAAVERDGVAVDARLAAPDLGGPDVHAGLAHE